MEKKAYRHELKYICSEAQFALIKGRLLSMMRYDAHADKDGAYRIRSVYFDDYEDTGFYENESGTDPREKFRVRIYNNGADRVELENKKKVCGMTSKASYEIQKDLCDMLLQGKPETLEAGENSVWNRFALIWNTRMLRPKVIVDYERTVYVCPLGNVRITFDRHISSSADYAHFFDKTIKKRPIMPNGMHMLEVKYDAFLPDYIYKGVELENLQRTTFSKYYLCRKHHL